MFLSALLIFCLQAASLHGYVLQQEYVGCYHDDQSRKLPHKQEDVHSIQECITKCRVQHYLYAGLQYGKQCFCGNSYDNSDISNKCDKPCPDGNGICGGFWANSIYRTNYPAHIGGHPGLGGGHPGLGGGYPGLGGGNLGLGGGHPGLGGGYPGLGGGYPGLGGGYPGHGIDDRYIGCYHDDTTRYLPEYGGDVFGIEMCITNCKERGYLYAGLQHSKQCFCGHAHNKSPESDRCDMPCQDGHGICGGRWANSIYKTDQDYLGCYKDKEPRDLVNRKPDVENIYQCKMYCFGYPFASLQFGIECYCGNTYNRYGKVDNCNAKCISGERNCGGVWANSIYRTGNRMTAPLPRQPVYHLNHLGCYEDSTNRKLPLKLQDVKGVEECIMNCRYQQYAYAGVQYGKQCFCGHSLPHAPTVNKCNMICENGDDGCGGNWANSIYTTLY